jgi:hypothetical protein
VLGAAARQLDADGLRGPDAAALLEDVAQGERSLAVIKTLLAKRVDETGSFRSSGHQSAADWLAAKTGSTFTAAQNTLAIGASLDELPEVAEAYRGSELSTDQAKIVVDTARRVPSAAAEMVAAATKPGTVKALRAKATRIKCAAEPDDLAWAARLHKNRYHRRWTADDGAACGDYRLAPEAGARLWAALDAKEEEIFHAARMRDPEDRESRLAYAADALVALTDCAPVKVAPLQVIIDGDQAELRGIGPIPLATAVALMSRGGSGAAARKSRRRVSRPGSKTRPSVSEGAGARRSGGARAPHPVPRSGSP